MTERESWVNGVPNFIGKISLTSYIVGTLKEGTAGAKTLCLNSQVVIPTHNTCNGLPSGNQSDYNSCNIYQRT